MTGHTSGDEEDVRRALADLDSAFARKDFDGVLELCADDVVFIGSGNGEEAVGRSAIGPMFATLEAQIEELEFSLQWDEVEVDVLGDLALLRACGRAKLATQERDATFRYRLTGVLVRSNGRWLWRVYHGSEPGAW